MENSKPLRCKASKTKISELKPPDKRKTTVRWTVVFLFLPRSGPNFSLRPKAALLKAALPNADHSAPRARDEGTHTPCWGRSAPPSLFYKKRRCRLAVPEKNRRGSRSPLPHPKHKKAPPTPPPSSREAPSLSSVGGPGGRPLLPVGHSSSIPPGAFLLDRQAARSLFPRKREWGAESASPWGRKKCGLWPQGKVRAALRQKSCAAAPRNS